MRAQYYDKRNNKLKIDFSKFAEDIVGIGSC